jgi:hypothetical protein
MYNILYTYKILYNLHIFEKKTTVANIKKEIPAEVAQQLKQIGQKVYDLRRTAANDANSTTSISKMNRMTLWRMQNGMDFELSKLLQILNAMGVTPEEFFKGIK